MVSTTMLLLLLRADDVKQSPLHKHIYSPQWRRQWGGGQPAVKPCAPAVPRRLSYSDVDHKRISRLRATDYFEDVNYDVINHAEYSIS